MNLLQKIKALLALNSAFEEITQEAKVMNGTKAGWQTTEFWLNVATQVGILWGAVQGFIPPKTGAIISTAGIAIYTVARTIIKAISDIKASQASDPGTATVVATVSTTPAK